MRQDYTAVVPVLPTRCDSAPVGKDCASLRIVPRVKLNETSSNTVMFNYYYYSLR